MRDYELALVPSGVNFSPSNETEEVLQNVKMICLTQKYSVPLDRQLGIEGGFLDEAVSKAEAKLKGEIVRAVKKYEPRARVTAIDFRADLNGKAVPKIRVRIIQ